MLRVPATEPTPGNEPQQSRSAGPTISVEQRPSRDDPGRRGDDPCGGGSRGESECADHAPVQQHAA